MASTYSNLKIELIGTGDQTGSWGLTTNTNLGTAIEEAIVGSADVAFASGDVTVTLTDTNATQTARNLRLNLTGTSGGARNLILGSGCQIEKPYLINNGLADAVTVKNTTGTGITVPAGKSMWVYNNGTNVVDAVTHLSSLTLGSPLPITSGGLGISSGSSGGVLYFSAATTTASSGTLSANSIVLGGGAGNPPVTTTTGTGVVTAVGNAVNTTGGLVTQSGTLTANALLIGGGSGTAITSTTTGANVLIFLGTPSSANLAAAVTDETGSGALVFGTLPTLVTPTLITPILGTPTSGNLLNCTADGTYSVGFREIPQNIQTGNYTLGFFDSGKHIYRASGGAATWTIPAASSVAYPIGTALTFINLSATSVSIAINTDTMYLSSAGTIGTRTLAQYGSATAVKVSGTTSAGVWVISGSGLT